MNTISSRITPISPNYETCLECRVSLLIYPGTMHPDEVSAILNMEPSQKNIIGDKRINSLGRTREIKIAGWFLSSEMFVSSKDLRDHINWITAKLNPAKAGLKKLQNTPGIKMTLSCVWWSSLGHSGPVLWPEQMKALADLDLECSFDIYFDSTQSS
ncbi:DUF4279 domain-containing protein [Candidatus Symbiopectobacterium sp. NZEC135]|uniref:DUF4279 domain-containing protein n=1 Tax=Candidatus Symbiopectobacterium sp. NZEC135 TaxID=2820471 RepID=UPI0022263893|nr:DUF4279 domain-containing protein [Candidatus Symbiopectobacterium sp. NZEC135]MCW2479267.1 DUF4279 domain-containing protein [Candidatus Symbiopectobacterium sp. NZEC135]